LASRRQGWAAIDPAPAIGTPAFDLADLTADYLDYHADTDDALAVLWETLQRIEANCGNVGASSTVADWMLIRRVHQIAIDSKRRCHLRGTNASPSSSDRSSLRQRRRTRSCMLLDDA
jgi:hypothetical protein